MTQPPPQRRRPAHEGTRHWVGYRNPHDFEGDDVAQQYLPDEIADHRYFTAGDQGHEAQMGARMEDRAAARAEPARRKKVRPGSDPMGVFGAAMKAVGETRGKLAAEQKKDVGEERRPPHSL